MSSKVKRSNGARSYSPRNNWKSSSKWIGPTLVSWLQPSKEEHPRMRGSNQPNPGTSMVPVIERLWTFGLQKWRIIYMPPHGGGQRERRGREEPWLHLGILQGTRRDRICPKELRLHLEVQTSRPCEYHKWKYEAICEGLLRIHVGDLAHASTATRWGITPRIVPSPKCGMGVLR